MDTQTTTEELATCPDCGQNNIMPRGLAAHRKSAHCARNRPAQSKREPLTLARLDAMPPVAAHSVALKDLTVPQLGEAFRGLDAAQENYSKLSGICATMKGLVLTEVKLKLGHGKFGAWLKEHFPKTKKTSAKYMRLADVFAKSNPRVTFDALTHDLAATLEAAANHQLDLANPLVARVAAWVGNRSAYQLELELKEEGDGRRNNPGGFRPSMAVLSRWLRQEYPEQAEELIACVVGGSLQSLPPEVLKRAKAEVPRYELRLTQKERDAMQFEEDARSWCEQITPALHLGIDRKYFVSATADELTAMRAAVADLAGHLDALAKERAEHAPKSLKR